MLWSTSPENGAPTSTTATHHHHYHLNTTVGRISLKTPQLDAHPPVRLLTPNSNKRRITPQHQNTIYHHRDQQSTHTRTHIHPNTQQTHLHLLEEGGDVHHHSVPDDPHGARVQHSRGKEVELEGLVSDHDGVPGVRAPGNSGADVVLCRQDVHLIVFVFLKRKSRTQRRNQPPHVGDGIDSVG